MKWKLDQLATNKNDQEKYINMQEIFFLSGKCNNEKSVKKNRRENAREARKKK